MLGQTIRVGYDFRKQGSNATRNEVRKSVMRLTCPSCAATYEAPAAAIGDRGRMVRCAGCGAEWFQAAPPGGVAAEPAPPPPEPAVAPPPPAPDPVPEPAPAAREPEIIAPGQPAPVASPFRRQEAPAAYRPPADEPTAAHEQVYFDPVEDPEPVYQGDAALAAPVDETRVRKRRDEDRDAMAASLEELQEDRTVSSGGAFLAGFSTIMVVAVVALGVYVKAPEIARVAPAAEAALTSYTQLVDRGRSVLSGLAP